MITSADLVRECLVVGDDDELEVFLVLASQHDGLERLGQGTSIIWEKV
jgi:hypothetical protein